MSDRRRAPPHSMKGPPPPRGPGHEPPFFHGDLGPGHEPPFFHGDLGPIPHPAFLDDIGGPPFGRPRGPPHPAALMEAQIEEIHGLLFDNQRLAATHVALKQELDASRHEIHHLSRAFTSAQNENESRLREAYERSKKMESDLHSLEGMKAEIGQIRGDIQKLNAERQDLNAQVQGLTHELTRASADMQQAPVIKQDIDAMKQEIQHARACIEHEKKGYAENYEQGQVMQKNLVSMAREVEKLRAEVANAEKRARAAAAAGNNAAGYGGNYGNPGQDQTQSYGGNPYPASYGANPAAGAADGGRQYGPGSVQGHGPWGAYDIQRAHGNR